MKEVLPPLVCPEKNISVENILNGDNKSAFTLAETLITLTVIGVVAVLTIPSLLHTYKQHQYDVASKKMRNIFINGLKMLEANDKTSGNYTSTATFGSALQSAFKVVKSCDKDHLTDCFTSEFAIPDDVIDVTTLTDSSKLGREKLDDI